MATTAAAWGTANRAVFIPFVIETPVTVQQVCWVNGATVNGSVDMGVYNPDGTLIVSAGSTGQSGANSLQSVDVTDTPLTPGTYFMAMASDSATGTYLANTNLGVPTLRAACVQIQATAFPLATNASPATFANPAAAYLPLPALVCSGTV